MTETKRDSWADTIEQASKGVLAVLAILFGLGLLITNVYQGYLGFSDYSVLRPRFVLAGLAFFVYIACPALVFVLPILVVKHLNIRRWLKLLLVPPLAVLTASLLATPFHYFVSSAQLGTAVTQILSFWSLYNDYFLPLLLSGVIVPSMTLAASWKRSGQTASGDTWVNRRLFVALLVLGVFSMIFPYTVSIHPNISSAVGGGQPSIADISLDEAGTRAVKLHRFIPKLSLGDSVLGPYVVWHETDARLFLSATASSRKKYPEIIAIPSEHVTAIHYLHGHMRVRFNGRFIIQTSVTTRARWPRTAKPLDAASPSSGRIGSPAQ